MGYINPCALWNLNENCLSLKASNAEKQFPELWPTAAAAAKSHQSCPTLCDPIDGSSPGFPVPGILQARTLEWVAISFSDAGKWKVKVKLLSRVRLNDPMDCSLPGSSIHGIFQARVLEWCAIAFSMWPTGRALFAKGSCVSSKWEERPDFPTHPSTPLPPESQSMTSLFLYLCTMTLNWNPLHLITGSSILNTHVKLNLGMFVLEKGEKQKFLIWQLM